ncbi:Protein of unknown function [Pyronema omphalodes CBS 100304]|uniref:Uncharacterized protein n=1 Tax=Pyronema omphalodes (strain CBS 100304) TaxID=1076935 RepID=U4LT10_PYROM|nr:Protein of unknown function [Pyronema omphalodes CBS 100304]
MYPQLGSTLDPGTGYGYSMTTYYRLSPLGAIT